MLEQRFYPQYWNDGIKAFQENFNTYKEFPST